jgi:hypothetical protein
MPEFEMPFKDNADCDQFDTLDEFTQGYVSAIFWTECNDDRRDEGLADMTFADLPPKVLADIIAECDDFQVANARSLSKAYGDRYGEGMAGADFWLTRNGHGAGFWDRGLGKHGEDLTKAAKAYGSSDAYVGDDGKLYLT